MRITSGGPLEDHRLEAAIRMDSAVLVGWLATIPTRTPIPGNHRGPRWETRQLDEDGAPTGPVHALWGYRFGATTTIPMSLATDGSHGFVLTFDSPTGCRLGEFDTTGAPRGIPIATLAPTCWDLHSTATRHTMLDTVPSAVPSPSSLLPGVSTLDRGGRVVARTDLNVNPRNTVMGRDHRVYLADGTFLLAWQREDNTVAARHYADDGTALDPEQIVGVSDEFTQPSIVAAPGGALVAWMHNDVGHGPIHLRVVPIDEGGAPRGPVVDLPELQRPYSRRIFSLARFDDQVLVAYRLGDGMRDSSLEIQPLDSMGRASGASISLGADAGDAEVRVVSTSRGVLVLDGIFEISVEPPAHRVIATPLHCRRP